MNMKAEKNKVQSTHFSGKQDSLHDTLFHHKNSCNYIYHISDDTNHDSVMTIKIIGDVIKNHPEVIESGRLLLRPDNCSP